MLPQTEVLPGARFPVEQTYVHLLLTKARYTPFDRGLDMYAHSCRQLACGGSRLPYTRGLGQIEKDQVGGKQQVCLKR